MSEELREVDVCPGCCTGKEHELWRVGGWVGGGDEPCDYYRSINVESTSRRGRCLCRGCDCAAGVESFLVGWLPVGGFCRVIMLGRLYFFVWTHTLMYFILEDFFRLLFGI